MSTPPVVPWRPALLQVLGQEPTERADAARNRAKILATANRMITAHGAQTLSLDEVAREAGVGVGTVYRRFGDRAGLVSALIDEREHEFQASFMYGLPPLGPGAPAGARLRAFLHALADRLAGQLDLVLLGETSRSMETVAERFGSGPYRMRHIHVVTLLHELVPHLDVHYLADALLAPLAPGLLHFQLRVQAHPLQRVKAGLDQLVDLVERR